MENYHSNSEANTSKALINNWDIFFPRLKFIAEKYIIEKGSKNEWNEIDILAYNSAKKCFVIIELKKGKDKKQLDQAIAYRKHFQKDITKIYSSIEKKYDNIAFVAFEILNPTEIILIAESFPDNYLSLVRKFPDIILLKYHWAHIDRENDNLLLDYYYNKPSKAKQHVSCIVSKESVAKKLEYKKSIKNLKIIKVTFPDGTTLKETIAIYSFIKTFKKIGIDRVRNINPFYGSIPLFINRLSESSSDRKKNYKDIGDGYIYCHHSTETKVKLLKEISSKLKINLEIEIFEKPSSIGSWERQAIKRKRIVLLNKIMKLTSTEISEFSEKERKIIIEKFG